MNRLSEYTIPELFYLVSNANFTEDEKNVFICLAQGLTIEQTAERCNMGVSTVKRKTSQIWAKIERLKGL